MAKKALKLFMLRHGKGGAPVTDDEGNVIYYSNKMIAKNTKTGTQVVSLGVDHRKYKGDK
ncbi:MAG: hypothetical protein Unbinned5406contig1000_21 [Prokaryotic dsDNA virus sp.]|nr:MAG: hypothetical protein Unbinned5406contig1000_21 [Prokaryotic dsDNA virus sp.]|tara:strand:+ start:36 stop:215 length:180 start_codon:yes stop_codon:yes gene_type:complete